MKRSAAGLSTVPLLLLAACAAPRPATGAAPATDRDAAATPLVVADGAAAPAPAADGTSQGWRISTTPYFWLFDIDGDVRTPRGRTVPVSAHLGDAWDLVREDLRFGFLGHFEASCGDLSLFLDGTYIHTESESSFAIPNPSGGPPGAGELDVDVKLEQVELGGAVRVAEPGGDSGLPGSLELLGGARWNALRVETDLALAGGGAVAAFGTDGSTSWVDPFVGARTRVPLGESLDLVLRGDVGGGFGDGSDRAWNVVALLEWRITDRSSAVVGYRWYDVERHAGGRVSDLQFEGPAIGLVLRF